MKTLTKERAKQKAQNVKKVLGNLGHEIGIRHCYEVLARVSGFESWNAMSAGLDKPVENSLPKITTIDPIQSVMGCKKVLGDSQDEDLKAYVVTARNDCGDTELRLDVMVYALDSHNAFKIVSDYLEEDNLEDRELWNSVWLDTSHSDITALRTLDNKLSLYADAGEKLYPHDLIDGGSVEDKIYNFLVNEDTTLAEYVRGLSENDEEQMNRPGNDVFYQALNNYNKKIIGDNSISEEEIKKQVEKYKNSFRKALLTVSKGY